MASPPLANYVFLLMPADDERRAVVVEAQEDWVFRSEAADGADVVLWGRVPLRAATSPPALVRHVARRERALRSLDHGGRALRVRARHRLTPPPGRTGALRERARDFLLGGAVVELTAGPAFETRLDAVVRSSGAVVDHSTFAPGSDRAATLRGELAGRPVVLRVGPAGAPSDPGVAAEALDVLEAHRVGGVPRVLGRGRSGTVAYVMESVVAGRRPRRVDDALLAEVADFLVSLPRTGVASGAAADDLAALRRILPAAGPDLDRLETVVIPALEALPGVMAHGDLWAGNVLVQGGRLSGVIDWDGARTVGVPGTDLLHLAVSQRRQDAGGDIGDVWLTRPWRAERFVAAADRYWRSFDRSVDVALLDAVGAAWWAGWLRQALERHERRLADERWLAANVTAVLSALRTG